MHGERLVDAFANGVISPVRAVYMGVVITPSMYEFVRKVGSAVCCVSSIGLM